MSAAFNFDTTIDHCNAMFFCLFVCFFKWRIAPGEESQGGGVNCSGKGQKAEGGVWQKVSSECCNFPF